MWTTILIAGAVAVMLLILKIIKFSALSIIRPMRARVWTTPLEADGLAFDDVEFPASDGVRLSGWFLPVAGAEPAPAVVILHGWLWNRLGTQSNNPLTDFAGGKRVELLPLARHLHDAGYHVLMFDMRNWGRSEARGVYTGGQLESRDLVGALDYLASRPEVDATRLGAVGFSVGANVILFAAPDTPRLRAAVAVQPAAVHRFIARYTRSTFGPLGPLIARGTEAVFRLAGGPPLTSLDPTPAAARTGAVPILFVQGTGDAWGGVDDVQRMANAAPNASGPLIIETTHRFDGYNHVANNPSLAREFLDTHMGKAVAQSAGQSHDALTPERVGVGPETRVF